MKITAHRGASGTYIELSEAAIEAAAISGCDRIEIDFHMLASGELVVMHDITVDRTTDGSGLLCEMNLAQFRQLHLLDRRGRPTTERPRLLAEVWEQVGGRKPILAEDKSCNDTVQVVDFIYRHIPTDMLANGGFQVQSFWRDGLPLLQTAVPALQTGILYHGRLMGCTPSYDSDEDLSRPFTVDELAGLGSHTMFNMSAEYIVQADVELLHRQGLEVNVYVVNQLAEAQRLEAMAVDGVITDYPSQFALAC